VEKKVFPRNRRHLGEDPKGGGRWQTDFLPLIVHLEPQIKTAVKAKRIEPKENWKILICLVGGFSTLALLIATVVLGHKALRRKWFKGYNMRSRRQSHAGPPN
jgi:hypothetical protein